MACTTKPECETGKYRKACTATVDSTCEACTNQIPIGGSFSSAGTPGKPDSCAVKCNEGDYRKGDKCVPCSNEGCETGMYRKVCSADADGTCDACTNKLPDNAVYSSAGVLGKQESCAWKCKDGFYRKGNSCLACSNEPCEVGEYRKECTADADGTCEACTNAPPAGSVFTSSGEKGKPNSCSIGPQQCKDKTLFSNGEICACPVVLWRGVVTGGGRGPPPFSLMSNQMGSGGENNQSKG